MNMEKGDKVLLKDVIQPNYCISKKVAELLGTKVMIDDIEGDNIKVENIWIPKEFVKEITFKHYTEEELERRSKVEEYCDYLLEKNAPLPLKIANFFSDNSLTIAGISFVAFVVCFITAIILDELNLDKICLTFLFIALGIFGAMVLLGISLLVFYSALKKMYERFLEEVHTKAIRSLKISKEEMERFHLHW